jgi:hypothetical protein
LIKKSSPYRYGNHRSSILQKGRIGKVSPAEPAKTEKSPGERSNPRAETKRRNEKDRKKITFSYFYNTPAKKR